MKRFILFILSLLLILSFSSCDSASIINDVKGAALNNQNNELKIEDCHTDLADAAAEPTNYVQFELENGATFVIELLPQYAPETVAFFQGLIQSNYYNGMAFHRICKNYCVYAGKGAADASTVNGEFSKNGYEGEELSHTAGTVSLFHGTDADSADGQFFVMLTDDATLNGKYAAFGRIYKGMETINAIAALPLTEQEVSAEKSKPISAPVIKSAIFITVEPAGTPAE